MFIELKRGIIGANGLDENNKFLTNLLRVTEGGGGITTPYFPSNEDLFFIVSIDGTRGAFGCEVKRVNLSN